MRVLATVLVLSAGLVLSLKAPAGPEETDYSPEFFLAGAEGELFYSYTKNGKWFVAGIESGRKWESPGEVLQV
ncbi:unnamed protein product, partial [marine sediment metagenome]